MRLVEYGGAGAVLIFVAVCVFTPPISVFPVFGHRQCGSWSTTQTLGPLRIRCVAVIDLWDTRHFGNQMSQIPYSQIQVMWWRQGDLDPKFKYLMAFTAFVVIFSGAAANVYIWQPLPVYPSEQWCLPS